MNKLSKQKNLLIICGPTSTGKTSLALYLAKKFKGEIVSADSRQVYKHMNIGTGKDLLRNSQFTILNLQLGGYYLVNNVKIWGYDLVDPKKNFSVARYQKIASRLIKNILDRGSLPILTGGTGLYIKAVVDGILTSKVPPNKNLRKSLEGKTTDELFEMLAQLDSIKTASLNSSDRKNPRRLIRGIEIASQIIKKKERNIKGPSNYNSLFIGLICKRDILNSRIEKRVDDRIGEGFEDEIQKLIRLGISWKHQSMTSLGYREWKRYLDGEVGKQEAIRLWKSGEKKYAKRQITWFKKDKRINWFDISDLDYKKRVEKLVEKWYKKQRAGE